MPKFPVVFQSYVEVEFLINIFMHTVTHAYPNSPTSVTSKELLQIKIALDTQILQLLEIQ